MTLTLKLMAHLILTLYVTSQQHSDRPGAIANTVSNPDLHNPLGDASVWQVTGTVEKVCFRVPVCFQEIHPTFVPALYLLALEVLALSSKPDRPPQRRLIFIWVLEIASASYIWVPWAYPTVRIANHDLRTQLRMWSLGLIRTSTERNPLVRHQFCIVVTLIDWGKGLRSTQ